MLWADESKYFQPDTANWRGRSSPRHQPVPPKQGDDQINDFQCVDHDDTNSLRPSFVQQQTVPGDPVYTEPKQSYSDDESMAEIDDIKLTVH